MTTESADEACVAAFRSMCAVLEGLTPNQKNLVIMNLMAWTINNQSKTRADAQKLIGQYVANAVNAIKFNHDMHAKGAPPPAAPRRQ